MRHRLLLWALCLLFPSVLLGADAWDTQYQAIERAIRQPVFPAREFCITSYGASPQASAATNQRAINRAIAACARAGGGKVTVPAGTFLTGAIKLKSHVCLVVAKGATLRFAFEPALYPIVPTRWEGVDCQNLSPCIYAYQATDVGICGEGVIDGGGSKETWWKWCGARKYGWTEGTVSQRNGSRARLLKAAEDGVDWRERKFGPADGLRPQLIHANQCDGLLIEGVTLLRSPFWVIHPLLSKNVTVRGVHIDNDGPNGDGCDPESCDGVLIENCFFSTGDDCIAIKSGRNNDGRLWNRPSQNIIIRGCEMRNGHGGIVIGSEISGGCRNVFAEDNRMDSPNLDRVVRIKTNTCRGGVIENIYVRRIDVGRCGESVVKINLDYEREEIGRRGFLPTVRNIHVERVNCRESKYGLQILALDTCTRVYDIYLRDCHFDGVSQGNCIKGQTRDIHLDNVYINGGLSLLHAPYKRYSQWMAASEMRRAPLSWQLGGAAKPKWSYATGVELEALFDTYLRYGDDALRRYCQSYTDSLIDAKGKIRGYRQDDYNLDQVRVGHFVARMQQLQSDSKNVKALRTLLQQLKRQPRTAEGVYWHKAIYPQQVWLDGLFMGLPFRVLAARTLLKDKEAQAIYADAIRQATTTYQHTLDTLTRLNRHAWDSSRSAFWADKSTGRSSHCWGRAQGWYAMSLLELLDALPADCAGRDEVAVVLRKVLDAAVAWQDAESGVWYQVMDSPGREGNYLEATSSSMLAYALLKAYRLGYVGARHRDAGIKAYRGIVHRFVRVNPDSTLSLTRCCAVAGLGPDAGPLVPQANRRRDGSFAYYISEPVRDNDSKGIGPFIWASLEMEALGYDTHSIAFPIDRQAVVSRHNPRVSQADSLAALSVGNGHMAMTVDVTGLQSFPDFYAHGVPLCTMTDWAWHSFPNPQRLLPSDTERAFDLGHGHREEYAIEQKQAGRGKEATDYFRANPHRLNLATVGLSMKDRQGHIIGIADLSDIRQELSLWDGMILSSFSADGTPVEVSTGSLADRDTHFSRIKSPLLRHGQACVTFRFAYPSGRHSDDANDWLQPQCHVSRIVASSSQRALIERTIDSTTYYVCIQWEGPAALTETAPHLFTLRSTSQTDDVLAFSVTYAPDSSQLQASSGGFDYTQALKASHKAWARFWNSGAIVDFSACTDPRAPELERRTVLSQYLTAINCTNCLPPQETGLTYNSWFGRPHLEMTYWHALHFALWDRPEALAAMLRWYNDKAAPVARQIARRQGFGGLRWPKMTDPEAGEAPSNTGSFLLWQQPHYIYLAEELYRAFPSDSTLHVYADNVEATAQFMADFAKACDKTPQGTIKLFGATAMQESMSKDFSYNHPFEQAYWHYGLRVAQLWRERRGLPRHEEWDDILRRLSPLHAEDSIYQAGEPLQPLTTSAAPVSADAFALLSRSDHPAVLGACGLLPASRLYDPAIMRKTLKWVEAHWNWDTTWGWDYGMAAMCAARLGESDTALNLLLAPRQKNTYLVSGHNYQEPKRLRIYLPGNGALLSAVALMCAGWDGCTQPSNPGFPQDGRWNVRWEGMQRMQ